MARLFQNWHQLDIIVQTGMASNIQKGSLLSDHSPFSISNFSPFFTPPACAGFAALSNLELNSLDFATSNNNLSDKDIQKMVHSKPYIPTQPHLFVAQINNWHAVLADIFGPTSILAINVDDVIQHYHQNELLYYNLFEEEPHFAVWLLNQLHFKCQHTLHQCAAALSIQDVQFNQLNFQEELRSINMNSVHAKAPSWYKKLLEEEKPDDPSTRSTESSSNTGGSNNQQRDNKRRTVNNNESDHKTKLKNNERYGSVVHKANLIKCRDAEVQTGGMQICNNWHIRGWCHSQCSRKNTHKKLAGSTLEDYRSYVEKLRQATTEWRRNANRNPTTTSNPTGRPTEAAAGEDH